MVGVDAANRVAAIEVHPSSFAARYEPGQISQNIGPPGAGLVIASGMGNKAIEWFRRFGIVVATGARSSVAEALVAYLAGAVTGAAQCRHEHRAMTTRTDPEIRALAESLGYGCRDWPTHGAEGAGGVGVEHGWSWVGGRGSQMPP